MCREVFEALVERGVPEEKLFLLRKGVDTDFFRRRDRAEARKRLGLPEGEFVIGFSAKAKSDDRNRKGVDVFLEALSRLRAEPRSPIRLALTGPGWEPTLAAGLPSEVAADYFPFLASEAMPDFYSAIDIYVSTARLEGGPLPPFEAMSCETPIVSTPVGMIREFVMDGVEGLLVPVDDAPETAKAIERLRDEPKLAAAMGRAGREAVARHLGCREAALRAHALYGAGPIQPRRAGREGPTGEDLERLNGELIASDVGRWNERRRESQPTREIAHIDLEELRISGDSWVLDLGCGAGQFSIPLLERGYRAVSVDLDAPRLGRVRNACADKNLAARILLADGANLPCHSASFDAVVCREMIEHVDEPGAVVEEIKRVLRPQGRLCVTVPSAHTERYFQWVDPRWLAMAGHVNVFTRSAMCELLEAHGFRVLEIRGRNFFYSLFWFIHTLARTTHDGSGRILDHFGLARRIFRTWRMLGDGRTKGGIERIGNLVFPKSYVYYCERVR
jgi:SAM-dependent methyltransferase